MQRNKKYLHTVLLQAICLEVDRILQQKEETAFPHKGSAGKHRLCVDGETAETIEHFVEFGTVRGLSEAVSVSLTLTTLRMVCTVSLFTHRSSLAEGGWCLAPDPEMVNARTSTLIPASGSQP